MNAAWNFICAIEAAGEKPGGARIQRELIGDMTARLMLSAGGERPSVLECSAKLELPFDVITATVPIRFRIGDWALVGAVVGMVRDKVLTICPAKLREEDGLVTDGVLGMFKDRPVVALTASREVDKLFVRIGGFGNSAITSDRATQSAACAVKEQDGRAKAGKQAQPKDEDARREHSRRLRETAAERQREKEKREYGDIPAPLATINIRPTVLKTGDSNLVMAVLSEIPATKSTSGQYKHEGSVQQLKVALSVQMLLTFHGLRALLGGAGRAVKELAAMPIGLGDIPSRLVTGREHLASLTAFRSEQELEKWANHKYAASRSGGERHTNDWLGDAIRAETETVRILFRAYQRAQLVVTAQRKASGTKEDATAATLEAAYNDANTHLSVTEACQVAIFADINPAALWIQNGAVCGRTFELARFVGRIARGVDAELDRDLWGAANQLLTARPEGTVLSGMQIDLREVLSKTIAPAKFKFALEIAGSVNGTIRAARATREVTVKEHDGRRYAIVAGPKGSLAVVVLPPDIQ